MGSSTHRFVVILLVTLIVAACSPGSGDEQPTPSHHPTPTASGKILTVAEALAADEQSAEVRGYILVGTDRVARLCTGLAGSYPPQCGNPSLIVEGLAIRDIPNRESDQGITWSGETTLRGALSGGILTVA